MKVSDLPSITELATGDRLILVRADGTIGAIDAALVGGGGIEPPPPPPPSGITLTWQSNGDTNGLFYHLGTEGKTQPFANPATSGLIVATQSTLHVGNPAFGAAPMCTQTNSVAHTSEGAVEFFQWTLAEGKKLIPNRYTYRGRRDFNGHHPRTWQLLGRVLETDDWIVLDNQENNSTIVYETYYSAPLVSSTAFSSFRFLRTGLNSDNQKFLTGSCVEFYGELV